MPQLFKLGSRNDLKYQLLDCSFGISAKLMVKACSTPVKLSISTVRTEMPRKTGLSEFDHATSHREIET